MHRILPRPDRLSRLYRTLLCALLLLAAPAAAQEPRIALAFVAQGQDWTLPPAWQGEAQNAPPRVSAISPRWLQIIGGLADAASTYVFLHRPGRREGNPMLAFTEGRPAQTALAVVAATGATAGVLALTGKRWPWLTEAISANLGAEQLAVAVANVDDRRWINSSEAYARAMIWHRIDR